MLNLTMEQLEDIVAKATVRAVRAALVDHPCRYRPAPETVDHVFGMLADIGDGDTRRGVEVVRRIHTWAAKRIEHEEEFSANHKFVTKLRTVGGGVMSQVLAMSIWAGVALGMLALALTAAFKVLPLISAFFRGTGGTQ